MSLASEFVISEFAVDDECWRVDWFGAVSFSSRYRRSSQPLIEVQVSHVSCDLTSSEALFEGRANQWPRTKQVRLPVGLLPMLKIGDFWKSGRLISSPPYDKENFADLMIDRDCKLIKAGLPDEDSGSHFVPLDVHPYHLNHTQSYCVQIPFGKATILVPCIELIRFYFGSSSNLLARLFDAPFDASNLWTQVNTSDRDGIKIDLALGISGRSAADVGRIALSTEARFAAELIGASCIAATARGERAYPKALFPFLGETCMSAMGKWLPKDGQARGVFLVFNLLSCSHPFPFSKLRYTSGSNQDPSKSSQPESTGAEKMLRLKSARIRIESKSISDVEPSKHLRSRGIGLIFGPMQFPDLARKPVSKTDAENVPSISATKDGMSVVSGFSVGEGGSLRSILPIDLQVLNASDAATLKTPDADMVSVRLFITLLRKLVESAQYGKVGMVRMDPRQRTSHLSAVPQVSTQDGEILKSCIITSEVAKKTTTRSRRVSVAMACTQAAIIYIFLMEQQEGQIEIVLLHDVASLIAGRDDLLVAFAEQLLIQVDEDASLKFPDMRSLTLKVPTDSCAKPTTVVRWVLASLNEFLQAAENRVERTLNRFDPIFLQLSYLQ